MTADSGTPVLAGGRVLLRPLTLDDAPALFRIHADPEVVRYTSSKPAHTSVDETRVMLESRMQVTGHRIWAIFERVPGEPDTVGPVGWTALFPARAGVADVTINLGRDAQHRMLARESLFLVMRYAFGCGGFHRLAADIDIDNAPSIRLFEFLGFAREGLLRQNWKTCLGLRDSYIYGITSADWRDVSVALERQLDCPPDAFQDNQN